MSSIYDDPPPSQPAYKEPSPFTSPPAAVPNDETVQPAKPQTEPPAPAKKKSGCGCGGCLLGCFGVLLVLLILGGIGTWYAAKKAPDWARQAVAASLEKSDLNDQDKQMVMKQVDRLVDAYKQDKVDFEKLGTLFEDFSKSPLMDLLIAFGAKVKYLEKSGLSAEEKTEAEKTLQRLAQGAIDKRIQREDLDTVLDLISTRNPNNGRQFHETLSDETLRQFLAEAKRLADEAKVPDEVIQVDIGAEVKKLVDKALGEGPVEDAVELPAEMPAEAPAETPTENTPPPVEKSDPSAN